VIAFKILGLLLDAKDEDSVEIEDEHWVVLKKILETPPARYQARVMGQVWLLLDEVDNPKEEAKETEEE